MNSRRLPTDSTMRTHNAAVSVTTADGCVHTDDTTKLSPTSCKFVYTPPTRRDSTVSSRRRRRCVLGLTQFGDNIRGHEHQNRPTSDKHHTTCAARSRVYVWPAHRTNRQNKSTLMHMHKHNVHNHAIITGICRKTAQVQRKMLVKMR